jgi:aryl-alcohol dehydrogenase-like predicted oxidoreductase
MALAPWNAVAGGKFRTDAEEAKRRETGNYRKLSPNWERNEQERKVSAALEKVANEVGTKHLTAGQSPLPYAQREGVANWSKLKVAIAYLLLKTPYVFPVVGCRTVEHLLENLEALDIDLTNEQMQELESAVAFDPGFPNTMIVNCLVVCCAPSTDALTTG